MPADSQDAGRQTQSVLRFASFELDVRSRELRSGGARVRLQEQPFEILRLMLERPGDVVTRDELRQRLWPDGTFVDFEHSLNAAVKRLRAALGDDAEHPRFVETLPRRGYRFIARLEEPVTAHVPAVAREAARLAVLPFTNLSGDASQDYFSDGLTEEMIAQLGQLGRGRVGIIARWSSMVFKGTHQRAREIGEALRADYLLEGSVRRDGDRVRITARLVETAGETNLWTETYDHHLTDCLLTMQVEVAARIARSLAMELTPEVPGELRPASLDVSAYQAYLKGRYYWNKAGDEGLAQAIEYFELAIQEDPSFAAASAGLARAHVAQAEYYNGAPRASLDTARRAAERALDIEPFLSDAHLAIGDIRRMVDWDWSGAEQAYAQAIALNPSSEAAHRAYALLLAALSRRQEAEEAAQRARELDPLCLVVSASAAWVSYMAGDYTAAIERAGIAIDMDPRFLRARRVVGAALLQSGRLREAVAQLEAASALAAGEPVVDAWLAHARAVSGDIAGARALLVSVTGRRADRYVSPYHLALALTGLGDSDGAFGELERACLERDPVLVNLAVEPRFEPLRSDGRFSALVERLNLPAEHRTLHRA